MPKQLQKKQVESLVKYVDQLQSLNEKVDPLFPKVNTKKLITVNTDFLIESEAVWNEDIINSKDVYKTKLFIDNHLCPLIKK